MTDEITEAEKTRLFGPQADEEEQAVLGAMMVSMNACALAVSSGLRAEHFRTENHRSIYEAASHLLALNEPVDAITVSARLKEMPAVAGAGRDYVNYLASHVPVAGNAAHYAKGVLNAAELRSKVKGAQRILEGVAQRDRAEIQKGIELATQIIHRTAAPTHRDALADEFIAGLDKPGVSYRMPWARVNTLLAGGLYPGDSTALIGHSGMGKTSLLHQALNHFQEQGYTTLGIDSEMPRKQVMARFVSRKTGIPYSHLMLRSEWDSEQRGQIFQAMNHIPWDHFIEARGMTVEEVCQEIAVKRADVAVIDTLHRLCYTGDEGDLREKTNALAETALATGTHLILVCHLNMKRALDVVKPKPVLRDILGSGAIEQASANVLAIHRDQEKKDGSKLERGHILVLKSRHGMEGEQRVRLIPGGYGFEAMKMKDDEQIELGVNSLDEEPLAA